MEIKEIMKERVISVKPDAPIGDVAKMMKDSRVHGIPVVDNGILVGIVTESDFFTNDSSSYHLPSYIDFLKSVNLTENFVSDNKDAVKELVETKVKDIMSGEVTTVKPDMKVVDFMKMLKEKKTAYISSGR